MKQYLLNNVFVVKKEELKKFIPLFAIGSFIIFNFIMLRQLKGAILTGILGPQALPIAKIYYAFPISLAFMLIYSKLSTYFDGRTVFIIFVTFFMLIFLSYMFLFNNSQYPLAIYLFFSVAESWSTVVFGTCMWAFFNDVCSVDEAKRFYVLVSGAQIGSIVASSSAKWLVDTFGKTGYIKAALVSIVISCLGVLVTVLFFGSALVNIREDSKVRVTNRDYLIIFRDIFFILVTLFIALSYNLKIILSSIALAIPFSIYYLIQMRGFKGRYKGVFEGVSLLFKSNYLILILLITLAYNFTIVVTEFIWENNLKLAYPKGSHDIFIFKSRVTFWTTTISALFAIFFTGGIMRYVGLTAALVLFPTVFGLSTSVYFFLQMTPAGGAFQWITTKIAKYSLADPAKQMLYIPCSPEERYKAKSVIEIFGSRGGKAFASIFNRMFLSGIPDLGSMAYFSYPILIIAVIIWVLSAIAVAEIFKKNSRKMEEKR